MLKCHNFSCLSFSRKIAYLNRLFIKTSKEEWHVLRNLYKMNYVSRVGPKQVSKQANMCVFQNRPNPLPGWSRRRRLNQGLVVAVDFSVSVSVREGMFWC